MDKYTTGIIAGIAGWIATFIWNIPIQEIGYSKLRYLDFASVMIYGHFPKNKPELALALITTIIWFVFLAYLFTYIIDIIGSDHLIGKGIGYGIVVWFTFYAITLLFDVPEFRDISVNTSFSNLVGSILYGLVVGYTVKKLRNKDISTSN